MIELASRFTANFEAGYGYPPDDNTVVRATPEIGRLAVAALSAQGVTGDLLDFYTQIEEVSLPDLGNGIFIHSAESVAGGISGNQPTEVVGALNERITVFGSDGGGALIALAASNGRILKLHGGAWAGSQYDVEDSGVDDIAPSLWVFLEQVRAELSGAIV
ncbi:hypothetical protein ACFYZB_46505 [Streptomyces sp. NPDC001852]|uniref:hypothetical protein n=1 Tax=Streptomyces sp. NPDC001852 TaxID=3364619 RepID=UPI0036A5E032